MWQVFLWRARRAAIELIHPFRQQSALRWWIAFRLQRRRDLCWSYVLDWVITGHFWALRDYLSGSMFDPGVATCRLQARVLGECDCAKFVARRDQMRDYSIYVPPELEPDDELYGAEWTFPGPGEVCER